MWSAAVHRRFRRQRHPWPEIRRVEVRGKRIIRKPEFQIGNSGFNVNLGQNRGEAMSHHYSGPDFGFPHGDARLDFSDLYAFPKPGDASKSILIVDVHPRRLRARSDLRT